MAQNTLKLTDQTNLLPSSKVLVVYTGLATCAIVSALDTAIVSTILPTISTYFNAGSVISWVPSAYVLTSTCFQPLCGRFSDIFGRKAGVCVAMSAFMIGCLGAGLARNVIELIVCRAIAGAGGGGIMSLVQITISDVVSLRERGKYQGIIAGTVAIGYAVGPPLGGALSEKASWRWCFWVNIPISFTALCVVLFVLPLKPVDGDVKRKLLAIDYLGVVLSLSGSALVILPLIWGGVTYPWNSPVVFVPLCSGIVVTALFCCWEWKGTRLPIVPMYIFKHATVTGVCIAAFVNGSIFFSSLYYVPQLFQVALGYSPLRSGVFLLPLLIVQSFMNWSAGVMISRTGKYRTLVYIGFCIMAVGCSCLATVTKSTPKSLMVLYMLLTGIGVGQTLQTTTVAAQASVSRKDMAVVTAVRNFARQLGGMLSLAIGSTIINNSLRHALALQSISPSAIKTIIDDPTLLSSRASSSELGSLGLGPTQAVFVLAHGYMHGFKLAFVLNACLAAVAVFVSFLMIKHKELDRDDDEKLKMEAKQLSVGGKGTREDADVEKGEQDTGTESAAEHAENEGRK